MKTRYIFLIILSLGLMLFLGMDRQTPVEMAAADQAPAERALVGNPAATYCRNVMGYNYEIRTAADGSQTAVCQMPDGETCNQWDFYAGTCGQDYSYCAREGLTLISQSDGKDPVSPNYTVCQDPASQKITPISEVVAEAVTCSTSSEDFQPEAVEEKLPPSSGIRSDQAPTSFDWRNVGGQDWITSVKNQASCGSCWAFAAVGVVEASENIINNNPALDLDLAEENLVHDCPNIGDGGDCSGGRHPDALDDIFTYGVVDEPCMPYTATDGDCTGRCDDWASRLLYADNAYWDYGITTELLKEYVSTYGPVAASLNVNEPDAGFDANDIYRCLEDDWSNHAVLVVGYDDSGGYFIIKNSWGTGYQDNGYFKVGYGECGIDTVRASWVNTIVQTKLYVPLVRNGGMAQSALQNGDFEAGQDGSWTEYSSNGWDIIMNAGSTPIAAHGGSYLAWLGGDYDDTSYIAQNVTITNTENKLHFWYYIGSEDSCGYDDGYIYIDSTPVWHAELCDANNTGGWVGGFVDLAAYIGQTVSLKFQVETNISLNSNLFIDDVTLDNTAARDPGFEPLFGPPFLGIKEDFIQ